MGKGKSSSAMGMICRALGYDMKVALVRFLKGEQQTGEDLFLDNNSNVVSCSYGKRLYLGYSGSRA